MEDQGDAADRALEQLTDEELEQRAGAAHERVKSALDIYASVPLGEESDAVLEQALDPRMDEFKRLVHEKYRRRS